MRYSPQQQKVIDYIERWGTINAITAISKLGITRLAARIYELTNTPKAMKAVKRDDVAPGFATYVPDWKRRALFMKRKQINELLNVTSREETIRINMKYTSKFAELAHAEREYNVRFKEAR